MISYIIKQAAAETHNIQISKVAAGCTEFMPDISTMFPTISFSWQTPKKTVSFVLISWRFQQQVHSETPCRLLTLTRMENGPPFLRKVHSVQAIANFLFLMEIRYSTATRASLFTFR